MDNNFSTQVKEIISYSREEALRLGNDFIGTEHLVLGLIRDGENTAIKILKSINVDIYELRKEIELAVKDKTGKNIANINSLPLMSHGAMLRAIAVARLLMPRANIQAPPNLSAANYDELLDAGINDWGGVSPLTPDFINPEKPWPHVDELRRRTEAKGFTLRNRLPVYPEFAGAAAGRSALLDQRLSNAAAPDGLARWAA